METVSSNLSFIFYEPYLLSYKDEVGEDLNFHACLHTPLSLYPWICEWLFVKKNTKKLSSSTEIKLINSKNYH